MNSFILRSEKLAQNVSGLMFSKISQWGLTFHVMHGVEGGQRRYIIGSQCKNVTPSYKRHQGPPRREVGWGQSPAEERNRCGKTQQRRSNKPEMNQVSTVSCKPGEGTNPKWAWHVWLLTNTTERVKRCDWGSWNVPMLTWQDPPAPAYLWVLPLEKPSDCSRNESL